MKYPGDALEEINSWILAGRAHQRMGREILPHERTNRMLAEQLSKRFDHLMMSPLEPKWQFPIG